MSDDDNVSNRFGPKRFLERASTDGKKAKAYKRAPKQEREVVGKLGGYLTPGSGSKFKKGDVDIPNLARVECKCTSADSFRVTREMLGKIEDAGLANAQIPYVEVEFLNAAGKPSARVAVLSSAALTSLLNRLRDANDAEAEASGSRITVKRGSGRTERNYNRRSPLNK